MTKRMDESIVRLSVSSHSGFSINSRTTKGRGIEPTMEAGNSGSFFMASRLPKSLRQVHVLLRIDLSVSAWRVGMAKGNALLDHVLEHVDEVRLLEHRRLAIGRVPELGLASVIELSKQPGAIGTKLCHADEFAGRFVVRDRALDPFDSAVSG